MGNRRRNINKATAAELAAHFAAAAAAEAEVDEEITTSPFLATVSASCPFRFQLIHAQVRCALRITHVSKMPSDAPPSAVPTVLMLRTLTAPANKIDTTTIAVFPPSRTAAIAGFCNPEDVVANVNIQLNVDEYTELLVEGPGTIHVFGEQYSQLIDEDRHHHMFGDSDEEVDDEDDDEDLDAEEVDEDDDDLDPEMWDLVAD